MLQLENIGRIIESVTDETQPAGHRPALQRSFRSRSQRRRGTRSCGISQVASVSSSAVHWLKESGWASRFRL